MQVVVLGMHRSGTSVLTHLLSRMGCHAGPPESLMPGDAANVPGYWERWDAWALDERILAAARASWWEAADLDLGSLAEADRQLFTAGAREIVAGLDEHRPWVLKDPRLCLVLPLWRPALSAPVFVIVHRDPLETARSLQARDGFPLAVGIALWEVYNLAALRHSLGAPRLRVSYGRLSADPGSVAASLAAELAPWTGGALTVPDAADLAEVVAGEQHHQRARPEELDQHLNASQRLLSRALDDGSALAWEAVPACSAGALDTLRSFAAGERERLALSRRAAELAGRCSEAEGEAAWLRDRDAEQLRWIASLREALDTAQDELGRLRPRLAELAGRCTEVEGEAAWLRERDAEQLRWIASLREALDAAEAELGHLRRRDAEISAWNDTLTARLAEGEKDAAHRAAAHLEEVAGLTARLESAEQARRLEAAAARRALAEMASYAKRCRLHAGELDGLVAEILRSRSWRLGRFLTAPARWGRRVTLAESRYEALRAAAPETSEGGED